MIMYALQMSERMVTGSNGEQWPGAGAKHGELQCNHEWMWERHVVRDELSFAALDAEHISPLRRDQLRFFSRRLFQFRAVGGCP